MKKINLIEWLSRNSHEKQTPQRFGRYAVMLIMLLTLGVGQMWGWNYNYPYVYFNNSNGWSQVMFLVGNEGASEGWNMSQVSNTNLWYVQATSNWGGSLSHLGMGFCDKKDWGKENTAFNTRWGYVEDQTSNRSAKIYDSKELSYGTYYFTSSGTSDLTYKQCATTDNCGSVPKYDATQSAKKRDTGTTYSAVSGAWPATLKLQGTHLSAQGTSGRNTITSTASTDEDAKKVYGAVVTGLITHTYESLSSSYYFEGWGTGSTPSSTDDSYEYNISSATTVYAFFSKLYTLDFDRKGTYGTSTVSASVASYTSISSGDKVPTGHTITVTASPATGYEVAGWYSDASCTSAYTNGTGGVTISGAGNVTFTLASLNANGGIYCKFQKKTYSITLDDDGAYQGNGSATVQRGDAALTVISHASRTSWNLVGYWNTSGNQVTDSEGALLTGVSGYTDGSGHWIYDGDVTLYAHWSQTYSLTVAAGSNISSVSGSNADVTLNSKYAISATPNTGYSFSGWTASPAENGTFDDASSASTNVTVKNGSVTVTGAATENLRTVSIVASPTGAGTFTVNSVSGTSASVGVTTSAAIVATPHADYTWTSWSATNCSVSPTNNKSTTLSGDGSTGSGTLTATFTLIPVKLLYGNTTPLNSPTDGGAMSYDLETDAYYKDVTTNSSPYYFRFDYNSNSEQYSGNWSGDYPGVVEATGDGTKVDCDQTVKNWENKASIKYTGASGSSIRIWFDYQNKKAWITETTYTVTFNNGDHGTVSPSGDQQVGGSGKSITATPATGWKFVNWSKTGAGVSLSSTTTNPTTVTASSTGSVTPNYAHRFILRGSTVASDVITAGMAGWSANDNSSYATATISEGVMTITANLTKAKTQYKCMIRDIVDNAYKGQTGDGEIPDNTPWTLDGLNDVKFTTTCAGTYTFTYNCSNASFKVVYPTSYTITYGVKGTGGTMTATVSGETVGTSPGKAEAGSTVRFSATPSSGYSFTKWEDGSGTQLSTDNPYDISSLAADKTVKAVFTAITYNSGVLKKNGGSADGSYSVTYMGTSITPSAPTKTGYHVDGYYKEEGTSTLIATAAGVLQNDKSGYTDATGHWNYAGVKDLYAKWAANTYTAENNIDGDGGSNGKYTATYDATSIAINTAPTRTGYNLTGYHAYGRGANTLANTAGALSASQSENKDGGKTLTNSSSQWIYEGSVTIYADWSPKTYSITLDQEGGASGSTSVTMTYDASTHTAITNPSKTGYTFAGYWTGDDGTGSMVIATDGTLQANVSTYTGEGGIWKKDATCTLYAKWTANNYTVNLDYDETGYGSAGSGVKTSVSATYGSAMPTMGTAPTPAAGYKFMGYFLGQNGTGVQYYAADGSSLINWNRAETTTLYAYFRKTEISSLTHPAAVAKGDIVTVDVNPVYNQSGAQDYMAICWSLLYDNDNPVESGVAIAANPVDGKPNQVRFTLTSLSAGYYKIKAVLKANASSGFDACSTGTELSTIKSDLRIAGNSKVTIQYEDADGNALRENATVEVARGDSIGVKAPSIIGYAFDEWVLGDVISNSCKDEGTCDEELDSINIKAAYDGYLTAKYRKKNMVYFNNTLEWEDVYVYFYNDAKDLEGNEHEYWADNFGSGANKEQVFGGNKPYWEMEHGHMTQIEGTNIWYFDYEAAGYTTRTKVSFANVEQSINKSGASNDEAYFHNASVVYRTDFDLAHLPMFVPINSVVNDYTTNTGSKYYRGYWMNYPESTGYVLKIFDNTGDGASLVKERDFPFSADKAMPMSVTVDLEGGNKTYGFKIYRADGTWYRNDNGGTMTNGHSGDVGQAAWLFDNSGGTNCGLTTTSAGNYTFTLSFNSDGNYQVGVHYPESTGDFRVMYTDDVRIANHDATESKSWLLSSVIPANTEHDTISYFVRAEGGKNPKYKIQKCTISDDPSHPGEEQYRTVGWADQGTAIDVPDSITRDSVYNFIFAKNDGNLVLQKIEPYTGNYYIRVDGAGSSNWDNFRAADHLMPYSDYSFKQSENPYSHYFTQWYKVEKVGDKVKVKNIKFVVANDYSVCVSDTIVKDGTADAYVDANGYITRSANIRFMYNHKTNVATRRYVDGAQENGSEFLMILSDDSKIYEESSGGEALTQLKFSDKGNWVYEAEVYALPTATYKLRSKFGEEPDGGDHDWDKKGVIPQYFKGGPDSYATLIGGDPESTTRVKIRLLYDFKTNRVVAAYQPAGTISTDLEIHADIMFMREHQGDIEQITFASGKSISEIENIYCGLKFNKYTLNNLSKDEPHGLLPSLLSRYERDIFYVSFPYDVRLSDAIGFGTYGTHWIVEYYDGAARAKNGFWMDSESYWKFVTPAMKDTFTLKAGTGYIVALDLDELYYYTDDLHAPIWNNTDEVEILFPGDISSISEQAVKYTMPEHTCTINRGTTSGNRTKKDSHWNVLGVPTFKNITGAASGEPDDGGGSGAIVFANTAWIKDSLNNELRFIYDGNLADNSLTPKAVKGFEFKAMHAYVVQYCGDVTFTTSNAPAPASVAARTYAEAPQEVDFRLELNKNGVLEDQTFVSLSNDENASADFRFGEDLSKEFNSNRANIYTFIGTEWVAGNTLPMTNQTTIVPVGVKIAADGEYTFSIPEGTYGVGITLIDNEAGARVNLGLMDYTVTLNAGQIDDRFVLEISPISQISTDVEAVTGDGLQVTGARKIMIDGLLYIVKDGVVYDARGNRVK